MLRFAQHDKGDVARASFPHRNFPEFEHVILGQLTRIQKILPQDRGPTLLLK
jgi:hypothetical protein